MRHEYERVLEPLLATYGTNNFAEDLLSNASISIEALGYYLFQDREEDPESNQKRKIGKRAEVVLQYLGSSFETSLAWFLLRWLKSTTELNMRIFQDPQLFKLQRLPILHQRSFVLGFSKNRESVSRLFMTSSNPLFQIQLI